MMATPGFLVFAKNDTLVGKRIHGNRKKKTRNISF